MRKKRDCPVCRREFFEEFAGEVAKVAWVEEHRRQQRGNGRYDGMEAQEREGAAGRGSSTPADEIEEYPRVGSPMREEEERREMEELLLEIDYTCQGSPSEK